LAAQTRTTSTPVACPAKASMSRASDASAIPPGSANATTRASTAEPRRASRRGSAVLRANDSGTDSAMSQVLRNRFSTASCPACPRRHSTRTGDSTFGGESPALRKASIGANASRERSASRVTPPASRINMGTKLGERDSGTRGHPSVSLAGLNCSRTGTKGRGKTSAANRRRPARERSGEPSN
jgi:hypothetical protein